MAIQLQALLKKSHLRKPTLSQTQNSEGAGIEGLNRYGF
jgi:hypothetical protein